MRNRGKIGRWNLGIFLQLKCWRGVVKFLVFFSFVFPVSKRCISFLFFVLVFGFEFISHQSYNLYLFLFFCVFVDSSCGGFCTRALHSGGRRWWRWRIAMELWVGIQEEQVEGARFSGEPFANIVRWFLATSFCIHWSRFVTRPWSYGFIGRFLVSSFHRWWHQSWTAATRCRDW